VRLRKTIAGLHEHINSLVDDMSVLRDELEAADEEILRLEAIESQLAGTEDTCNMLRSELVSQAAANNLVLADFERTRTSLIESRQDKLSLMGMLVRLSAAAAAAAADEEEAAAVRLTVPSSSF
jgi:septal ring factor EnvC (AmiA/AmiB activator)